MDTDALIAHARTRFDHETSRRVLKEKYQARMLFAHRGGMWRAGPELIVLLATVPPGDAVVLDLYETPVQVNPEQLRGLAMQLWQEQMNAWLVEFDQQRQLR
jgi:hypothetical protein